MKLINYLLIALVFVSSCKKEEEEEKPTYSKDYGDGMYIATENGISFYDGEVVKNQIYKKVNGSSISDVKKIKFKGTKAYIVTENKIVTANVETFENKETIDGFINPVDFDFVSYDRLFVVDKDDSRIKVVDLASLDITSDIETGDVAKPNFIISNWYRSVVLNGGLAPDSLKDSTIVAIDNKDSYYPLADFVGSLAIGDNPNSAIWDSEFTVLCKGIYDANNPATNTESSLYKIDPWNWKINSSTTLPSIYNANNLVSNSSGSVYYFIASGGIYNMYSDGTSINNIVSIVPDVLSVTTELYAVNDSTNSYSNMLYFNDANDIGNKIYKYNIAENIFCDTIEVDSKVTDINFY